MWDEVKQVRFNALRAAETGGCQEPRPIWARERHAKPGVKEPLTLILGQPPRESPMPQEQGGQRGTSSTPNTSDPGGPQHL